MRKHCISQHSRQNLKHFMTGDELIQLNSLRKLEVFEPCGEIIISKKTGNVSPHIFVLGKNELRNDDRGKDITSPKSSRSSHLGGHFP